MRKRVLITGGTGTVGLAFIAAYSNEYEFYNYSRSEKLQQDLKRQYPDVTSFLGSIDDRETLLNVYDKVKPHIVVHAAALKHVDLAEKDPMQTMNINVIGSLNVIDASIRFRTPVTVAISTDKACEHQNIYGMSKFLMERCILQANTNETRFVACRFANVAHSNGSVIPFWLKSAAEGKPLRVTDPTMNRMMFAPSEAAALVKKAVDLASEPTGMGGFILTKKMKNVNILDLAKVISENYEVVGSRPGEKQNEDLVSSNELPFTLVLDESYVAIGPTVVPDEMGYRLTKPLNTSTAEQMTENEIRQLVYGQSH